MNITTNSTHVRIELNGASFAIPKEVIKGIKKGEIPDDRYYHASTFLSGETREIITPQEIKEACENIA